MESRCPPWRQDAQDFWPGGRKAKDGQKAKDEQKAKVESVGRTSFLQLRPPAVPVQRLRLAGRGVPGTHVPLPCVTTTFPIHAETLPPTREYYFEA